MNEMVFVYKLNSGLFALEVHKIAANTTAVKYEKSNVKVGGF